MTLSSNRVVLQHVRASLTPYERLLSRAAVAGPLSRWKQVAPNLVRCAYSAESKPRPDIKGLKFPDKMFDWLWYEDKDFNRIPMPEGDMPETPEGAETQHSKFPNYLHHTVLLLLEDGTSKELLTGQSSWPDDLVTEMVRSGDWNAEGAIQVAAQSCERCLNVLLHHYDTGDHGYAFGSDDYWECNTCCDMCLPIAGDPHPNGTGDAEVTYIGDEVAD